MNQRDHLLLIKAQAEAQIQQVDILLKQFPSPTEEEVNLKPLFKHMAKSSVRKNKSK